MKNKINKVKEILADKFGICYFDDAFINEIKETLEWYDKSVDDTVEHISNKYEFQHI